MIRAKRVYFRTSQTDLDRLYACNRESAQVWNESLRLAKAHHMEQGKWISKSDLQSSTKRRFHLHSQSIQAVCHKYIFARDAAHQAIQKGVLSARYPYRQKQHYNTKWAKDGFKIFLNGRIELSMGIQDGKREKPIVVYASHLPQGQIKEMELCHDQGLYLSVSFEDGIDAMPYVPQQAVGVDLGEIHTISAFCESGQAMIVTGRKVRSIHQLRNKKLAEMSRLQSKCNKGSKRWKQLQKVKGYIRSKSARQLQDALHKTTRQFVDWCFQQMISDVYVGNPEGIQRNTRKKKKVNRQQAQKLSNWSFGQVRKYLRYKLTQVGMKLHEVDESYTSQTCPVCKKRKKVSSRNFVCVCGYHEHRDVHGGRNILSKAMYGEITHFDVPTTLKYLRIA